MRFVVVAYSGEYQGVRMMTHDVVIIGAGPAGSTLATLLARQGR
ncbi:MAG: FAD-dependent monooxygenase, partial [Planctomycetales bacterium]|nr:FAD-dependent monooxygenase [Planctomycetales bacterium]